MMSSNKRPRSAYAATPATSRRLSYVEEDQEQLLDKAIIQPDHFFRHAYTREEGGLDRDCLDLLSMAKDERGAYDRFKGTVLYNKSVSQELDRKRQCIERIRGNVEDEKTLLEAQLEKVNEAATMLDAAERKVERVGSIKEAKPIPATMETEHLSYLLRNVEFRSTDMTSLKRKSGFTSMYMLSEVTAEKKAVLFEFLHLASEGMLVENDAFRQHMEVVKRLGIFAGDFKCDRIYLNSMFTLETLQWYVGIILKAQGWDHYPPGHVFVPTDDPRKSPWQPAAPTAANQSVEMEEDEMGEDGMAEAVSTPMLASRSTVPVPYSNGVPMFSLGTGGSLGSGSARRRRRIRTPLSSRRPPATAQAAPSLLLPVSSVSAAVPSDPAPWPPASATNDSAKASSGS